jgi:hypothetical protein
MKRKLNMDELESFIADSADEVRMYPSDRVWRNIDKELHGEKQWPALTFGAVLTTAIMLATLIFLHPDKDLFVIEPMASSVKPGAKAVSKNQLTHSDFSVAGERFLEKAPLVKESETEAAGNADAVSAENAGIENSLAGSKFGLDDALIVLNYATNSNDTELAGQELLTPSMKEEVLAASDQREVPQAAQPNVFPYLSRDAAITEPADLTGKKDIVLAGNDEASSAYLNKEQKQSKLQRWGIQYYATPSISYRILTEEKYFDKNLFPGGQIPGIYYNDVRRVVNQDAGFGAEAGAAITYAVTDRLSLKGGLQFNMRRYNINAYKADITQASAIRLQQNGAFDTMMAASDIINFASENPTQIRNQTIQLSMPIGFELAMAQFGKSAFVVAATLQPTFNISQQSWMITSDYQRYVKEQSLARNFNLNAGFEAFFRFKTKGNLSWQVGPQIRYQLRSSFADIYPVKENLIDYGFKIGLSKTLH